MPADPALFRSIEAGDRFIGLMSGTSLDGVDGVLLQARSQTEWLVTEAVHADLPAPLRAELLALNTSGPDELHRSALAANGLMGCYAQVVGLLLQRQGLPPAAIRAIGAHGQTVRHQPAPAGQRPDAAASWAAYTLQLGNPALLAELTGIAVVADFRSRDVAAGGQGAPLVPAFHHALFGRPGMDLAVANVGGMANVTLLPANGDVTGFDTGPGNVLMDSWCERHLGTPFDTDGQWAAQGEVLTDWLQQLLAHPYFHQTGPRSTGRDLFNAEWLDRQLALSQPAPRPVDVQATLAELTARTISAALPPSVERLLMCGGGALNAHLMRRLRLLKPKVDVNTTAWAGVPVMDVEAAAFAWLAARTMAGLPGNVTAVTGAAGPRILGAVYPA